jgi:chromosome segregation protein
MDIDQLIGAWSAAAADQLRQQLGGLLAEANAAIHALEEQLSQERQARERAEAQLAALQASHQALQAELDGERQARSAAEEQLQVVYGAIAEQLEHAEAEHEAEQAARAEQERCWTAQVQRLEAALGAERRWREQQQQRIETLRRAATALFASDQPFAAEPQETVEIPGTVQDLLAGRAALV